METQVVKWGNGQGIRIPRLVMNELKKSMYVLVLSRDFFNRSGIAVVCPVKKQAFEDALHIPVKTPVFKGTALLEHIKNIDLQARFYRKITEIPFTQIQDISDAVQSIFEYYPSSL